ncbi:ETS-related transcription factor Elf-1-like [Meleagris gallopavo]|uniref:ETS-related transcription factor Elf-1-like n=1 Tax=Meleagris gallopavo TaxID=9103 RepID=UPI000549D1F9|nr:ETS-related transcription factor Elf-1-like [Meleagris gallopavo]
METIEAAEALLNMDSPGPMLDEKRIPTMFGSTEDEDIVAPITHVSVSLDGIPEVVEVHQAPDPYAESPETPEFEQPKKKRVRCYCRAVLWSREQSMACLHPLMGLWSHPG